MWKEITGHIEKNGVQSPYIEQVSVVDSGNFYLKRERKRNGIIFKTQPEISSYLEIVNDDLVRPQIRLYHDLQVFVGFVPTSEYPHSTIIPVGGKGTISTIPHEMNKQDIWVANKDGELRGLAWFNHRGERIKPRVVQRGRSFYRSEAEELAEQEQYAYWERIWENDRERFPKKSS